MRKIIIVLASVVTVFLVTAAVIPLIFKDDIRNGIERVIDESLDAQVYFDVSGFGLTLFKNFPNPTVTMDNFGIIGINEFKDDTLLSVQNFDLTLDLFSVFSKKYTIKSINLFRPRFIVLVLPDGKSNYEIVKEAETDSEALSDSTTEFNLAIDQWNISDGQILYHDKSYNFLMHLKEVNHTGGGNLSLQQFDLSTTTSIREALINFDGTNYLDGQSLFLDATLGIDLEDYVFTFKNNHVRINDFPLSFDGSIAMTNEDIDLDISFATENSNVKSLYSLIPGVYTTDYESISAQGEMAFSGNVRGIYDETSIPSFNISLGVTDGMLSYPDLPTSIDNINFNMLVDCNDGILESTIIEIKEFNLDLGNNPVNGSLLIRNLKDYSMKADLNAKIDLAELSSLFPIEETELRGQFSMNLKADGIYDSVSSTMPSITARMSLQKGYIKNDNFPKAIEDFTFDALANCNSGRMEDMLIEVDRFKMTMSNQDLSGALNLYNLVDYQWDLKLKGGLDLEIISEVYPVEGITYKGLITSDIETKGKYSDVEAGRYDRVPTHGSLLLTDFYYKSDDLQQGIEISKSSVIVDPSRLVLESFIAESGKSDINLSGVVSNYFDYLFQDDAMLQGKLKLTSNALDINEWITGEETTSASIEDTISLEALEFPKSIDFEFRSSINHIYYDDLDLQNAKGLVAIKDGVLDLTDFSFNLLGGSVTMNGKYDSRIAGYPAFNYNLDLRSLSIPEAFTSFSAVQTFAPMTKLMDGSFSTKFKINGLLKSDMSPVYQSLNGSGLIEIADASISNSKLVSSVSGFLKTGVDSDALTLKDVVMKTSLENGRAHVSPFDISIGGQDAQISGSIGADGSLDYYVSTEVDAGVVGEKVNQLLAGLRGEDKPATNSKILLNFNVSGTYENPIVGLAGTKNAGDNATNSQGNVKTDLKKQAESQVEELKNTTTEAAKDEATILVEKSSEKLQQQLDTLKKEVTKNLGEDAKGILDGQLDSTTNEIQQTIKNLFKKKKN